MRAAFIVLLCLLASNARAGFFTGPGGPGTVGGRAMFVADVMREATTLGVPPALADAVAMIETGYRPDAMGSSGEIGMMQILPSTALQLGFHGTIADLFQPEVNIHWGVEYLSRAWALSGGNVCRALMKYRAGLGQESMSLLSSQYCSRAISWLTGVGSNLATDAPGMPHPPPKSPGDPYVIAVAPYLAAQASVQFVRATPHELLASYHPHRSYADRNAALQARFDSHLRH